jgi:hypothetical protein
MQGSNCKEEEKILGGETNSHIINEREVGEKGAKEEGKRKFVFFGFSLSGYKTLTTIYYTP